MNLKYVSTLCCILLLACVVVLYTERNEYKQSLQDLETVTKKHGDIEAAVMNDVLNQNRMAFQTIELIYKDYGNQFSDTMDNLVLAAYHNDTSAWRKAAVMISDAQENMDGNTTENNTE